MGYSQERGASVFPTAWSLRERIALCGVVSIVACIGIMWPDLVIAETAIVKYRGPVDLTPFACEWVTRSSVVQRLCYDPREEYVIVNLAGTYYHYCEVPPNVVAAWRQATSMGRFYNTQVRGRFDCRVLRMPLYTK